MSGLWTCGLPSNRVEALELCENEWVIEGDSKRSSSEMEPESRARSALRNLSPSRPRGLVSAGTQAENPDAGPGVENGSPAGCTRSEEKLVLGSGSDNGNGPMSKSEIETRLVVEKSGSLSVIAQSIGSSITA